MSGEIEWCEERAETIAHDADDEEYLVLHLCRHARDHDGPHGCWLCSAIWDSEPPC
jgi:hypothetical protein